MEGEAWRVKGEGEGEGEDEVEGEGEAVDEGKGWLQSSLLMRAVC